MTTNFVSFSARGTAAALALIVSVAVASAQDAPAPTPASPPPAAPSKPDTKWVKVCNTDPASKKELCLVIQELRAETGQFIASATVRQFTGDSAIAFIAAVPPGMLIQPGIQAVIDNGKPYPIKYGICFPNACYGELKVDATFVNQLKAGAKLVIKTLNQQGKTVAFPISLTGFTKTYDGKGLDAAAAKAKQDELNKALQARAEEARKRLIEQQQKESGLPTPAPAK